jgi:hypothetical protein
MAGYIRLGTLAGLILGFAIAMALIGVSALGSLLSVAGSAASASSLVVLLIALLIGALAGTLGGLLVTLLCLGGYVLGSRVSRVLGLVFATGLAGGAGLAVAGFLMRVFAPGANPLWVLLATTIVAAGGTFAWFWTSHGSERG